MQKYTHFSQKYAHVWPYMKCFTARVLLNSAYCALAPCSRFTQSIWLMCIIIAPSWRDGRFSTNPARFPGRPLIHNTLDDPESGCLESDDERMHEVAPITEPPDDWLYDYGISSESDWLLVWVAVCSALEHCNSALGPQDGSVPLLPYYIGSASRCYLACRGCRDSPGTLQSHVLHIGMVQFHSISAITSAIPYLCLRSLM